MSRVDDILAGVKATADTASQQAAAGVGQPTPAKKSATAPASSSAPTSSSPRGARGPVAPAADSDPSTQASEPAEVAAPAVASTLASTASTERKAVMASTTAPRTSSDWLALATNNDAQLLRDAAEFRIAALEASPRQLEVMKAHVPDSLKPFLADIMTGEAVSSNGSAPTPVTPATPVTSSEGKGELVKKEEEIEAYKKDGMVSVFNGDQMLVSVPEAGYASNPAFKKAFKKASGNLLGRFNF